MTGAACSRRGLLAAGLAIAGVTSTRAEPAARIAVLDWGWAATLVALGLAPAAVAETRAYAHWVREPALPAGTAELGLRTAPSFETLFALRPDLILTNTLDAAIRPTLERIAPTLDNPTFGPGHTPLMNARAATRLLGERVGRAPEADRLIRGMDARLAAVRTRLADRTVRPVVPLQLFDRRHLTFYGRGSLFGDVLNAVELRRGFDGATTPWGLATGDMARLGSLEPADLLLIDPLPPGGAAIADGPSLFTSLIKAAGHRLYRLPAAWPFGDLTAATRFGKLVAAALTGAQGVVLEGSKP